MAMTDLDPRNLPEEMLDFLRERHLATLTIVKADHTPHVTPVGVTYEQDVGLARVITWADSWKAKHVASLERAEVAVCSVDGARWVTLSGVGTVTDEPEAVAEAVKRYAERYRQPKDRDDRVVIEIAVGRIFGQV